MAHSPVSPSPFHKIIEAVSKLTANPPILALSGIVLLFAFWLILVFTDGANTLVFGCIVLIGLLGIPALIGVLMWREQSAPRIPYSEEYLLKLLELHYFYGESQNLVSLSKPAGFNNAIEPVGDASE